MFMPIKYDENITKLISKFKLEQEELRKDIKLIKPKNPIRIIAGCDSAFLGDYIISIFVMFKYPSLEEIEVKYHYSETPFPYIPGFLSFRELPNLIETYKKIENKPDLIMVDGSGIMHPRRLGIATHLGIKLNTPTFGVAKNKLFGKCELPSETKGSLTYVKDKEEIIGVALRSKDKIKPIYISPGNLCDLETALKITLETLQKHKLPEPTRIADKYSKSYKEKIVN
jgi:deoxyribonuclease V